MLCFRINEYETFINYLNSGNIEEVKNHFKTKYLEKFNSGNRPIHIACNNGHVDIVKFLYENNCDMEAVNQYGDKPIHIACSQGHIEIVKLLLENKCDLEAVNKNGDKPIHKATNKGNLDIVKLLHENNCDMESKDKSYYTPLHLACQNGQIEIVQFLLKIGCNIESSNNNKYTPMHCACQYGNVKVVKLLCENNCNIDASNYNNDTPLHCVCNNGNIEIVKLLLNNHCNIDSKNILGKLPIDMAIQNGHDNIFEELNIERIKREMIPNMTFDLLRSIDNDSLDIVLKAILVMANENQFLIIDSNSFGEVFKWRNEQSNFTLAIKSIKLKNIMPKGIEEDINSYRKIINHKRIVQYIGVTSNSSNIFIFMEYIDGGSLENKIKLNGSLQHSIIVIYSRQILEGLSFLHEQKIVHRDVKPKNILMVDDENLKLCDFGLSRLLDTLATTSTMGRGRVLESGRNKRTFCGTAHYMAPEIIHGLGYTVSVDIWSLGATIIEMLTGKPPYSELDLYTALFKIAITKQITFEPTEPISNNMKIFIDKLLNPDYKNRETATILLEFLNNNDLITN